MMEYESEWHPSVAETMFQQMPQKTPFWTFQKVPNGS